jgi:hypothetical protein
MVTSLERRIQEFSLRMGQQPDSFSQEIQVRPTDKETGRNRRQTDMKPTRDSSPTPSARRYRLRHPADEETSRNRRQTYMILIRGQTDSFSQEIQVETSSR